MIPVPRPVKRPWIACAYFSAGVIRVDRDTNHARTWRSASRAYRRSFVSVYAVTSAGIWTDSRINARLWSLKLPGLLIPSFWMYGPPGFWGSGHQ